MTHYIVYHLAAPEVDCPDGIASAWVASKVYPEATVVGCTYDDRDKLVKDLCLSATEVSVVDFSFNSTQLQQLLSEGIEVEVIDHHKTAYEDLSNLSYPNSKFVYDVNQSGATLTWKHWFPGKVAPHFLEYVKDRDIWNFQYDETQFVHEAMGFIGRTFKNFDYYETLTKTEFLSFILPLGQLLLKPKLEAIDKAFERLEWGEVAGYKNIPYIILEPEEEHLTSDICTKIYKTYPDALFCGCLCQDGTKWSLRSNKHGNDTDVGAIAKANGGGGHKNASGYSTKTLIKV